MYHKATLFNDPEIAEHILTATNPFTVKKLGQQVKGFDEEQWKANRLDIVRRANVLKFTQNEELRDFLLATEDKILVEASPYDKIWGIGKTAAKAMATKDEWGLNLLGEALMDVRKELRNVKPVETNQVVEDNKSPPGDPDIQSGPSEDAKVTAEPSEDAVSGALDKEDKREGVEDIPGEFPAR